MNINPNPNPNLYQTTQLCVDNKHGECDGYGVYLPLLTVHPCKCVCHAKYIDNGVNSAASSQPLNVC